MSTGFSHAFAIQRQALWALMLREIHVLQGNTSLGYLWEILKSAFGVAVFWAIRTFSGYHTSTGMHVLLFIVMGFLPIHMFANIMSKGVKIVSSNLNLLTFPHITPLDLSLSSALVISVTKLTTMAIFVGVMLLINIEVTLVDPVSFGFGLIGLFLFSYGFSLLFSALNLYVPVIGQILPMILRINYFCSGVFFSITKMSRIVGDWITWNPLACYIELLRGAFLSPVPVETAKVGYIVPITLAALALGLILERYTRKKVMTA